LRDKTAAIRPESALTIARMTMTARPNSCPAPVTQGLTALRATVLGAFTAMLLVTTLGIRVQAQDDPLIARVNGVEIRQSDLTMAEEDLDQQAQALAGDARRDYLVAYLSDVILAAQEAEKKKVQDQKEFKSRIAFIRNKLLMETLLQDEGKVAVTEQAMRKVYEEAVKQMGGEMEVRARHILVPTETEAKTILAEVKKGTDFAELAKQKSKDPGAAAEGGDLGYFSKEQMVPEFSEAAFKLEKGQVSEPVKSQFGWHIIKVEDKRSKPVPEFEKVKDQVETYVMRKSQGEFIAKLRESAKIERLDKK
jgi:peptidyl-prolyl cis-trans isomerase C